MFNDTFAKRSKFSTELLSGDRLLVKSTDSLLIQSASPVYELYAALAIVAVQSERAVSANDYFSTRVQLLLAYCLTWFYVNMLLDSSGTSLCWSIVVIHTYWDILQHIVQNTVGLMSFVPLSVITHATMYIHKGQRMCFKLGLNKVSQQYISQTGKTYSEAVVSLVIQLHHTP